MKKTIWKDYERGSGAKAMKMRGLIWLHVFYHMNQKDHPKHPYQVRINDKSMGYAATIKAGKEFAEKKFKEHWEGEA